MKNIFNIVKDLLLTNTKYVSEDGKLLKATIYEDAVKTDEKLLELLLQNDNVKNNFFKEINNILVFDKQKFLWFIELKEFLPNSYTRYTNKIGLTNLNSEFISKENDIVLSFPFKDCFLQGNEENEKTKTKEIFYNEIIASDEISTMLSPKVFINAKRYKNDVIEDNITFNDDDNLIIKGNNLIALYSIVKRFEGKIKCIYIDPPYNTGNDSFNYNDSFNHSSWLTFMKNRLEIAKRLLSDDGLIFIHIDRNEMHYLKVLLDETSLFGRKNELSTIIWLNKEGGGKSDSKFFVQKHEYILCYAKNKEFAQIYPQDVEDVDRYKEKDEYFNTRGPYQLVKLDSGSLGWVRSLDYPITHNGVTYYAGGDKEKWEDRQNGGNNIKDWGWRWRWSKDKLDWGIKNDFVVFKNGNVYTKQYLNCDNDGNIMPRKKQPVPVIEKYSNTQSNKHMKEIFGSAKFNYSKPEGLIYEILNWSTNEGDIVLDFFAGSGTTCSVAHKMKRQYIGIEQMNYIEDITVERMKKVINGEQGGISKILNWKGGGSFVFCELLEDANSLIEKIESATDKNIFEIKELIYSDNRIVPFIDHSELMDADEEFEKMSLNDKKISLLNIINKNKLYVNYHDIEDISFDVHENDRIFSNSFYKGK